MNKDKSIDIYSEAAKILGMDRPTVKMLALQYMYSVESYGEKDLVTGIVNYIKRLKSAGLV